MTVPIAAVKGNQKMNKFDITYFHGPTPEYIVRPETIADIAAAGITLVPLSADAATIKRALPLLDKFGLKAVVHDHRMNDVYSSDDIAGADAMVREIVEDYAGFDNIVGWDLVDEPSASKFPILAAMVRALRRYSPDCETVINLFPSYASPEQLGHARLSHAPRTVREHSRPALSELRPLPLPRARVEKRHRFC